MNEAKERNVSLPEYCHERMGENFARLLSDYDTTRRLEVLIDDFMSPLDLRGKRALDVGCGLGFFAQRLVERGAIVTACDIGPTLVELTRKRAGCECIVVDALHLRDHFGDEQFDIIVSSECIEHTCDPRAAVNQMLAVLKPGGVISLSTPNVLWEPIVKGATAVKIRPFDGLENFSSWGGLRQLFVANGVSIMAEKGLHLFPFQIPLHGLSRWCDAHLQALKGGMINICISGRKYPSR